MMALTVLNLHLVLFWLNVNVMFFIYTITTNIQKIFDHAWTLCWYHCWYANTYPRWQSLNSWKVVKVVKDIIFSEEGIKIMIKKSKTDQLREGNNVFISKTSNEYCPVEWLRTYLSISELNNQPDSFLLCRPVKTQRHKVKGNFPISYTTARESFKSHLSKICNPQPFGLHSSRSGEAEAVANNDVQDRLISKHGRWSSNSSRDGYIKDNSKKRFKVLKTIGF